MPQAAAPYSLLFVMVNRNLIREFDVSEEDWNAAIGDASPEEINWLEGEDVNVNQIVEGRVLRIDEDFVLVDVGYKSEGIIPRNEGEGGDEPPQGGEAIRVLVEDVGDGAGRRGDRRSDAEDKGRVAGGHWRDRVPAGEPGRHPPPARHRRVHRQTNQVP